MPRRAPRASGRRAPPKGLPSRLSQSGRARARLRGGPAFWSANVRPRPLTLPRLRSVRPGSGPGRRSGRNRNSQARPAGVDGPPRRAPRTRRAPPGRGGGFNVPGPPRCAAEESTRRWVGLARSGGARVGAPAGLAARGPVRPAARAGLVSLRGRASVTRGTHGVPRLGLYLPTFLRTPAAASNQRVQLLAVDHSARASMKNAASCEK